MNKKYVSVTKKDRTQDAKDWLITLSTNPKYLRAVENSKGLSWHSSIINKDKYFDIDYSKVCNNTAIKVFNNDVAICANAAITVANKEGNRVGVLNFASYLNPGGGYLTGALSQEESICRMSGLFPILLSFSEVYANRRNVKGRTSLYDDDDFIYSKDVPFMAKCIGDPKLADVITIAAPNLKFQSDSKSLNIDPIAMIKRRMETAYTAFYLNKCDVVLLGAFGCGAFGNDVEVVAKHWNYLTNEKYPGMFKEVIHPVFDNIQSKVFKKYCQ